MNILKLILESVTTKMATANDSELIRQIELVGGELVYRLKNGKKILVAGNGGSAADAQHFAAELAGKFVSPTRPSLPAIALTTNSSNVTAIGNDFGFDEVFSRQVSGLGNEGDIFIGISTSGNSANIIKAVQTAKEKGLLTVGLLGNEGGKIKQFADYSIIVPSKNTQSIQEAHIMLIHILCAMIDEAFSEPH